MMMMVVVVVIKSTVITTKLALLADDVADATGFAAATTVAARMKDWRLVVMVNF